MILHMVQEGRHICEVPGCGMLADDWDHCIFSKNNRKKEFHDFTYNPFNFLRACKICNRITHNTDRWPTKKWLIDYHLDGEYRAEFLEWIGHPPHKFQANDMFQIYNYIATKLDEERNEK